MTKCLNTAPRFKDIRFYLYEKENALRVGVLQSEFNAATPRLSMLIVPNSEGLQFRHSFRLNGMKVDQKNKMKLWTTRDTIGLGLLMYDRKVRSQFTVYFLEFGSSSFATAQILGLTKSPQKKKTPWLHRLVIR